MPNGNIINSNSNAITLDKLGARFLQTRQHLKIKDVLLQQLNEKKKNHSICLALLLPSFTLQYSDLAHTFICLGSRRKRRHSENSYQFSNDDEVKDNFHMTKKAVKKPLYEVQVYMQPSPFKGGLPQLRKKRRLRTRFGIQRMLSVLVWFTGFYYKVSCK